MKTLVTLALLSLMCFLRHSSAGPVGVESVTNDGCCPGSNRTLVPKGYVKDIVMTPSSCKPKAIVITTVCDERYCIDPDWIWAKKRLEEFKKSPTATFNTNKCEKKGKKV